MCECVCLLSKLHEAKYHVNVTLDMDELDITSAESKATYEEIKDYVLEKHGLQVTNLYIAQVKRKCGIIERENYNKSQKEDTKQPQCPEDKEKAIMLGLALGGLGGGIGGYSLAKGLTPPRHKTTSDEDAEELAAYINKYRLEGHPSML